MNELTSFILSPNGIRTRAQQIYQLALEGRTHFEIHEHKLTDVSDFVLQVIAENYPDKNVPYHSRWRHYEVGNQSQLKQLRAIEQPLTPIERAKLGLDLILPSVLVDAGAGPDWQYSSSNSVTVGRSEGLGLASLDMFLAGDLSHNKEAHNKKSHNKESHRKKVETTAAGLKAVSVESFSEHFNVSNNNPLLGVEGRVQLLRSLGEAILAQPSIFPNQRPGDLVDYVVTHYQYTPTASQILTMVITFLGNIWPGRLMLDGTNLGDTWAYPPLREGPRGEDARSYVPFHKLSQWISYSVIETLANNGFTVTGVEELTGLAEYRNGGLMLDSGLISLRNPANADTLWTPGSEIIIEWRALTICLLDKIAEQIVQSLNTTAAQFPLAKVLEGGTWAAGRKLALQKRNNLTPPLNIKSDATVF
ncbi:MAG: hypothetical protein K0Q67_1471 [Cellvibrio sp.]|nr:hypothetical protein [Cellvibrio sp.]